MSWMEKLYRTYEAGMQLDLKPEDRLMPISHTLQNAHINIVIDGEGNFKRALVLEKTQIVLPATEKSAGRSSGEAPHPLADKIQYVAKDYPDFGGKKKAYFEGYRKQLLAWCESGQSHAKVEAVYRYIAKGKVVADLIAKHVLHVDAHNVLLTRWPEDADSEPPALFKVLPKEKGELDQGNALVCWSVENAGDPQSDTWKDQSIQAAWIAYDNQQANDSGLCFVSGDEKALSVNHPAKIRHTGDKAKLISSNDSSGYTFRGRFLNETQACAIGYETSQKAHNALRWLVARQGFRNGDQAYVAWAVSGKKIPQPLTDSFWLMSADIEDLDEIEETEPEKTQTTIDHSLDTGQSYAEQLRHYMAGYAAKLDHHEQITIMGIDSATPGRMGIVYYREMLGPEFLDRLENWHKQFAWPQRHSRDLTDSTGKKPKTQVVWPISSPVPKDIAVAAYGENVDDTLKKKVIERLLPCIIDGQPLPRDLLENCVRKASNRNAYSSDKHWLWEKNLGITCALFRGFYLRHPHRNLRRDYSMALEENYAARDYLYGRLLAIAEYIEEIALNIGGEKRPTTAARLMQRFADRPFETWRTIELALQPYMQRLRVSRGGFLTNRLKEIDAIKAMFDRQDFTSRQRLSGEFLLGYHCQRHHFKHKSDLPEGTPESGESA